MTFLAAMSVATLFATAAAAFASNTAQASVQESPSTEPESRMTSATPAGPSAADDAHCDARIDALASAARATGSARAARALEDELASLGRECTAHPQIEHDLGALAARRGDWDAALAHLGRSLELDARAAATVEAMRAIHRHRAALAYADALGSPARDLPPPELALQDSGDTNSEAARLERGDAHADALRDESVLDYELFSWWHSKRAGHLADYRSHYARALEPPDPDTGLPDWDSVSREIELTDREAVAVVRWPATGNPAESRRLLFLRIEDSRWKIYRERAL